MGSTHWRIRLGRFRRQLTMDALRVLPRSALRMVPGSSRSFGPPRQSATWGEYRQRYGAAWREVFPAQACTYPRPETESPELAARLWRADWPALGIAVLKGGRVLDAEGWPVGQDDTVLIDLATGIERREYMSYLTRRCVVNTKIKDRALNLGTCYARENYCHFLLDALPRLELFLRSGLTFNDVDWILVPNFIGSSREDFFRALKLPAEKLVRLAAGQQYEFSTLYQPSFPGRECFLPPWVAEFYRQRLQSPLGIIPRRSSRLYVARSQRGVVNDAEVWAALSARGFVRVEPTTWEDNVKQFASADLVVGPHGAGLSNVIFCPTGARLIELVPGDRPFPYFYSAASAAGLHYSALLTTPLLPAGREYQKLPSDQPYRVDVQQLCAVVDAAISG